MQDWIATVRIRALEDLALIKLDSFCNLWESHDLEMCEMQSKTLYKFLKAREDVDLGWLPLLYGNTTNWIWYLFVPFYLLHYMKCNIGDL